MLTKKQLAQLRADIIFCSYYLRDYANRFDIDEETVCNFFDSYAEYLAELMAEDGHTDGEFFDMLEQYDTADNLWSYYSGMFVEDPLPLPKQN